MTLSVTAAADFYSPARVLVTVSSSPSVTDALKVWRVHPDGSRHRVLTVDAAVIIGEWVGYDYHAPFNQVVTYTAETDSQESAASVAVYLPSGQSWLIAPTGEAVMADMLVGPAPDVQFKSRSQRFQVLNRKDPVHRTSAPRGGRSGDVQVLCETLETAQAVLDLLSTDGPILLNTAHSEPDLTWAWVQPDDVSLTAPSGRLMHAYRAVSFGYEETSQPDADLTPTWTFEDVADAFATFEDASAAYDDFKAMFLDVRTP